MAENGACPMKNGRNIVFVSPDTPSKCTWKLGTPPSSTPHTCKPAYVY